MSRFRGDRAFTLACAAPLAGLLNDRSALRIPILMYHGIGEARGGRHPYFETNTSPAAFERHMSFLKEHNYKTISVLEAVERLAADGSRSGFKSTFLASSQSSPVVLTFDDGYENFYEQAFPILARHGFMATLYVVSGFAGKDALRGEGKEYMSWTEIRAVHSHGIVIGSHTVNHPELVRLSGQQVECEIRDSKAAIENELGDRVTSFAYPYAFPEQDQKFVGMLRRSLENNGYQNGVCTMIGTARGNHDPFFLPRIPMNSYDDLQLFKAKLSGGYDWLHCCQMASKRFSSRPDRITGQNSHPPCRVAGEGIE